MFNVECCRSWVEESYFRPFGLRVISNQALYESDLVVVIYSSPSPNMSKYVRNRAAWLGEQDPSSQCGVDQLEDACQSENRDNFKVAISVKEDFKTELTDCGFSPEGM